MLEKVDVAKALEKLRGDLKQNEAARRAKIHFSTWNRYEQAAQMPKSEQFAKIAAGLGCTRRRLAEELMQACVERVAAEEARDPSAAGELSEAPALYRTVSSDPSLRHQQWVVLFGQMLALAREEVKEIFQEALTGPQGDGGATTTLPPADRDSRKEKPPEA